ncbi:MAG: fluoride efflux transporter CrcB [Gemmatimonadaceae bacterium]|nr:fluoride efflux transporter CrcB [Gemmatimonadaceae bacterium]
MIIWYVAAGSAAGGVARYLLSVFAQRESVTTFPWWTLLINVLGSLLLGFLMRYIVEGTSLSANARAMLTTGFCGGFTTFSTFSYETVTMWQQGGARRAATYVGLSVVLSLGAMYAGLWAAERALGASGFGDVSSVAEEQ